MRNKRVVYTSLPDYVHLNKKKFVVCDYSTLNIYKWAAQRINEMKSIQPSFAEEKFLRICKGFSYSLFRQVFFRIDGKCYFLDFFIADKNIAIEIDGKYHQETEQRKKDRLRDRAFKSIGIRTIRFSTEEMTSPDFKGKYYIPRLAGVGKKICPKQQVSPHQLKILRATETINRCDNNSTIEIRSTSTPFLYAISHKDLPKQGARDLSALADFYEAKKTRNIKVVVRFIGSRDNLMRGDKRTIERWDAISNRASSDMVEVI